LATLNVSSLTCRYTSAVRSPAAPCRRSC